MRVYIVPGNTCSIIVIITKVENVRTWSDIRNVDNYYHVLKKQPIYGSDGSEYSSCWLTHEMRGSWQPLIWMPLLLPLLHCCLLSWMVHEQCPLYWLQRGTCPGHCWSQGADHSFCEQRLIYVIAESYMEFLYLC